MEIFIVSFIVFAVSGLALALGFLVWGRPLRGSCGQAKRDCQSNCGKRRCPNKPNRSIVSPEE